MLFFLGEASVRVRARVVDDDKSEGKHNSKNNKQTNPFLVQLVHQNRFMSTSD